MVRDDRERIPVLSYRHGFHAGNHADVLKHVVLIDCLQRLAQKETPLLYVDTHAGAGSYALREGYAAMNEEWAGGIERLRTAAAAGEPPRAVAAYLALVDGYGKNYPGSPAIAAATLRRQDRLVLFELHPSDAAPLSALLAGDGRAQVRNADGFAGLRGVLPPVSRRALVLVDPSYELAADYDRAVQAVSEALRRFATGVYLIWYPLLERGEAQNLPGHIVELAEKSLDVRLRVRSSLPGERGMSGSGMVVINPPWMLKEALDETMPWLTSALAEDAGASWSVNAHGPL